MKNALFALFLSLPLAGAAHAADAKLGKLQGTVMVHPGGGAAAYAAKPGDGLYFGDRIRTEESALAHVVFKTGTAVLVKPNAALTLEGSKKDVVIAFDVGEFLIGLKRKLAPGRTFRVRTPAAVAAVRGTLFWGLSDENKDSTYACFESRVEIQAEGASVLLEPGQKVKIVHGQAPGAVEPAGVPISYLDTFALDGSLQGLEQLASPGR